MVLPSLMGDQVVSIGYQTILWLFNMLISVGGLFISLFMYVSHDDLKHAMIEPAELAESINTVSLLSQQPTV